MSDTAGKVFGDSFAVVPEGVLYAPGISCTAKILWAIFQRHADHEGRCYPSLARLAELMGVSKDTVGRAKKELADSGLIATKERFDASGRRTSDDVFLRGAHRKSAGVPPRTDAVTRTKASKNEISKGSYPAKTEGQAVVTASWIRPPSYVESLDDLPEKAVDFDPELGLAKVRELRRKREAS